MRALHACNCQSLLVQIVSWAVPGFRVLCLHWDRGPGGMRCLKIRIVFPSHRRSPWRGKRAQYQTVSEKLSSAICFFLIFAPSRLECVWNLHIFHLIIGHFLPYSAPAVFCEHFWKPKVPPSSQSRKMQICNVLEQEFITFETPFKIWFWQLWGWTIHKQPGCKC